jgi:hypothetical protein
MHETKLIELNGTIFPEHHPSMVSSPHRDFISDAFIEYQDFLGKKPGC